LLALTNAYHDARVDFVRHVLRGSAVYPQVGPEVALPDLSQLFARKCLENLQKGYMVRHSDTQPSLDWKDTFPAITTAFLPDML